VESQCCSLFCRCIKCDETDGFITLITGRGHQRGWRRAERVRAEGSAGSFRRGDVDLEEEGGELVDREPEVVEGHQGVEHEADGGEEKEVDTVKVFENFFLRCL
jgi:hypothetical protein